MMLEELRHARLSRGLSQRRLGEMLGISTQTILRLEAGIGSMQNLMAVMVALEFHLAGLGRGANLAEQLATRRALDHRSLEDIATMTGMSRKTVADLEKGMGTVRSALRLLAALAPNARPAKAVNASHRHDRGEDRDKRFTPPDFMDSVYAAFGPIDLDPCGNVGSPVVAKRRFLLEGGDDGLRDHWKADLVFCNPPFSALIKWLRKAHQEWISGRAGTIVCLVAVRLESRFIHEVVACCADIYIMRGRMRFWTLEGPGAPAPFGTMIVTFGAKPGQMAELSKQVPGRFFAQVKHATLAT